MILYSCRHRQKLHKWNSWLPKRQRQQFYNDSLPTTELDCVDLNYLQKNYTVVQPPQRKRDECVLLVHGRGATPRQLRRYFGGLEAGLSDPRWDIRALTWPSAHGLRWYGASSQSNYAGSGTARLRSYHASRPMVRVIQRLADQGYHKIHLVGHSLGGNVINNIGRTGLQLPGMMGTVVLMSPDVLVSQWAPIQTAEEYHIWVHPRDVSLKWSGPDPRVGRAGVPTGGSDGPLLQDGTILSSPVEHIHNPLLVTKIRKFTHDSYPHCPDVLGAVKAQLKGER